jgi:serine/threonine protein kinase
MKLIHNKEDMDKIRAAARDHNSRTLNRKETFLRKQETEFRKREELRKKESKVRNIIAQSLPKDTSVNWEIDLSDLDFVCQLGHGTSGAVYKGFYQGTIPVAMKLLKAAEADAQKEMNEFIKEFKVAMTINSPYIVRFYGATLKHRLCLVMEFCEKGSLFNVLSKDKDLDLTWDLVFSMLEETVSGIVALHNFNPSILHRDLKTLNVLVTAENKCKVCDFGLSRFATGSNVDTLLKCRGTLAYIASEVYNQKGFFPQSDVYSLAIMMWEVVNRTITGQYLRPYHDIKMEFVILTQAHTRNRRPPLPDTLPNSFRDLITLCWDADHLKRPDANQLLLELQKLRAEYYKNRDTWDKVCYATKSRVPQPPVIILETVVPNSVVPVEQNGLNTSSTGRTLLRPDKPQLRHGGGGSVSKATAMAALGLNNG